MTLDSSTTAILVAIPSLGIAIAGLYNGFTTRREVKGKAESVWMTLTKESTDMVLERIEELKRENIELKKESTELKRENVICKKDMIDLKRWLQQQGIRVPDPPDKTAWGG